MQSILFIDENHSQDDSTRNNQLSPKPGYTVKELTPSAAIDMNTYITAATNKALSPVLCFEMASIHFRRAARHCATPEMNEQRRHPITHIPTVFLVPGDPVADVQDGGSDQLRQDPQTENRLVHQGPNCNTPFIESHRDFMINTRQSCHLNRRLQRDVSAQSTTRCPPAQL